MLEEEPGLCAGTLFYLEYKLAKLLLCPLDEKYPGSRYAIRGFSRQSDSTAISSIPSHSSTERQPTGVPSHVLLRLPSQTRSTPACLGRLRSGWTNAGEPVVTPIHLSRAALASSPDQEFTELHMDGCRKPFSGSGKVLQFDLNETRNSQEGEGDTFLSPCFGSAALQQLKEEILGTRAGMDSFREFLHGTLGIHLLDFWIDCEDIMEHTTCLEKARTASQEIQLFFFSALRSIQAKYKLMLPPACRVSNAAWGAGAPAFFQVTALREPLLSPGKLTNLPTA
uniref:uncharacterized protein LOC114593413 n=1 Tax=Podarcis muralis TaxID=64176 RepID=UPI0010A04549|nr:uncharacterized protein LOC114593413 [Podarcis muralis]